MQRENKSNPILPIEQSDRSKFFIFTQRSWTSTYFAIAHTLQMIN